MQVPVNTLNWKRFLEWPPLRTSLKKKKKKKLDKCARILLELCARVF